MTNPSPVVTLAQVGTPLAVIDRKSPSLAVSGSVAVTVTENAVPSVALRVPGLAMNGGLLTEPVSGTLTTRPPL